MKRDNAVLRGLAVALSLLAYGAAAEPGTDERDAAEHHDAYLRFLDECGNGKVAVGQASSMEAVRPRAAFKWREADAVRVRLARGERESVQIIVASAKGDLKDVGVEVDMGRGSAFSSSNVTASVVGFVRTTKKPPYKVRPAMKSPSLGWWPDAILDFQKTVDVCGEDVQSFWVRVTCPTNQPAGDYVGVLRVMVGGKEAAKSSFHVHVNDFSVGRTSPLPLSVSFKPCKSDMKRGETLPPDDYRLAWKTRREAYCDWLADYYLTWDSLYVNHTLEPQWDMLLRLKEQGRLGLFNLCYWWYMDNNDEKGEEFFRKKFLSKYRERYDRAKELGLLDHAYFGGCGEQKEPVFKKMSWAIDLMHKELPGVPLASTVWDWKRGTDGSPLAGLDIHIPLVIRYYPEVAKKAREEGRKVWWYICNWPNAPWINGLLEDPPCQLRILMGALTQKMKPDGFLYYETANWLGKNAVTNGPWIDWDPRTFAEWHGDGQWTYCGGPDLMPLATLRLENFRDGIDDLWYAKLLEQKLKQVESSKMKVQSEEWIRRAKAALAVPDELARDGKTFTIDTEVIYRWRDEMADLIEQRN